MKEIGNKEKTYKITKEIAVGIKEIFHLSRDMLFPTMWYMRLTKPQISLRICAVWSKPLLVAWIFDDCLLTDWTSYGASKLNRRLHRLFWVCSCQNTTLLEITCRYLFHLFQLTEMVYAISQKSNFFNQTRPTEIIFNSNDVSNATKIDVGNILTAD